MTPFRISMLCALLVLVTSPLLAAATGGGSCGRCEIPYPNEYFFADGFGTSSEASSYCAERLLDAIEPGWDLGGYVIKWVGEPPEAGQSRPFNCYACLNNSLPTDGPGVTRPPVNFAQAGWIALDAYPGEISAVEFFLVDDELQGLGASYEVTIVNPSQRRAAIVRIDPFSGLVTIVEEASAQPQSQSHAQ